MTKRWFFFTFPNPFESCNTFSSSTLIVVCRCCFETKSVSTDRSVATRKTACCCFPRNRRSRIRPPRPLRRTLRIRRTVVGSRLREELGTILRDFRNVFRAGSDFGCPGRWWADGQTSSEEIIMNKYIEMLLRYSLTLCQLEQGFPIV